MMSKAPTYEAGIVGLATLSLLLDVVAGTIFFTSTIPATAAYINTLAFGHIRLWNILYPIFFVAPLGAILLSTLALFWNRHIHSAAGKAIAITALAFGLLFCCLGICMAVIMQAWGASH
ncbi:hypothetical protein [Dictyobacter kobayashii]|uniref:Uncharacterized protein n=1 Tax=Dictyobacter kobayashii TaxID=2014872 RepID=A0A402AR41_9CHLR|nr:hypothetical protein [Dictyobacter kobayashii]GCE21574.1 hypothetical protein KDK_53740 [Dictyobacter kobayashii]